MKKSNLIDLSSRAENADPLTDLIRQGARKLIEQVIEAELMVYMEAFSERKLSDGRAAVVRNGYQPERERHKAISGHPLSWGDRADFFRPMPISHPGGSGPTTQIPFVSGY